MDFVEIFRNVNNPHTTSTKNSLNREPKMIKTASKFKIALAILASQAVTIAHAGQASNQWFLGTWYCVLNNTDAGKMTASTLTGYVRDDGSEDTAEGDIGSTTSAAKYEFMLNLGGIDVRHQVTGFSSSALNLVDGGGSTLQLRRKNGGAQEAMKGTSTVDGHVNQVSCSRNDVSRSVTGFVGKGNSAGKIKP